MLGSAGRDRPVRGAARGPPAAGYSWGLRSVGVVASQRRDPLPCAGPLRFEQCTELVGDGSALSAVCALGYPPDGAGEVARRLPVCPALRVLRLEYTGGIESCFRGDHPEYIEITEKMM